MTASTPHDAARTARFLPQVLREHAERAPGETAFVFPAFDESTGLELPAVRLSRGELDRSARALAATLQAEGAGGGRVLLLLPPGPDFVVGLFACYYAGCCAIACPPPAAGHPVGPEDRFAQIGADAEVAAVVTAPGVGTGEARAAWVSAGAPAGTRWLTLRDTVVAGGGARPEEWTPPRPDGAALALLQYTSGSTGVPKGVMVSYANLLEQLRVFRDLAELPAGADVVTWMPVYHALGIAGTVTMSQFVGGRCTLLTPDDFIAEPFRWLKAVSDATAPVLSCGPNFAYDRCVERITPEQRERLDLGRWHAAFNAAERIQRRTIEEFTTAFTPHGFRREAWFPGYGLTEVTLGISGRRGPDPLALTVDAAALEKGRADGPADHHNRTLDLVGCGPAHPRVRMLLVDPATRTEVPDGEVGEVWIDGDVVNQGYWRRPEQTEETFAGHLADGDGPYLRSGDLAFRHSGEIVICGRLKELIIIRGRNIHPQDVEAAARRAHPALATAPAAAFSVDGEEGERLVLAQSVPSPLPEGLDLAALAADVRAAVAADQEVEPYEVLFVHAADIPMTGSGKIRRTTCRQTYLDGGLSPLHTGTSRPAGEPAAPPAARAAAAAGSPLRDMVLALPPELREAVLVTEVRRRVGALLGRPVDDVPADRPLAALGLESLRSVELRHGLARDFRVPLPMADFLGGDLDAVAALLARGLTAPPAPAQEGARGEGTPAVVEPEWPPLVPDPEHRHDPFPLTEIQHAYLTGRGGAYELGGTSIHLYTEHDHPDLDVPRLRRALDALVRRHEMLRAVISSDGTQRVLPEVGEVPVAVHDLRAAPEAERAAHLDRLRDELSHRVLPSDSWPLFHVHVTRLAGTRCRVHLGIDLLVADVASVRMFFLELGELYAAPDPDALPAPARTASFRDYVLATRVLRDTDAYRRSRDYWLRRIDSLPPGPRLPQTATPSAGPARRTRRAARLDAADWARIRERAAARGLTPSAVQLAAYAAVLGTWSRSGHFTLDLPLFNRHPLHKEVDSLIGDFTSVTLLEVDLRPGGGPAALADRIQRQLWQDLDHRWFSGVEVLRELTRARGLPATDFSSVVFASAREQGRDQDFAHGELGADWLGEPGFAVSQTPQVLLDHQVYEDRGALTYKWDAVEERFPPGVLDEMFHAYGSLLRALADDEAAWDARHLPDLLPEQQRRLHETANSTAGPVPDGLLCSAFLEQAARRPEATAVIAGTGTLGYGELHRHACRHARRLRAAGAGPGRLVAVHLEKGPEQIVAVLAVQLAGAAYLPLDPELPAARREWLLEHSGADLVLTAPTAPTAPAAATAPPAAPAERWPEGVTALPLDLADTSHSAEPLTPPQTADDLAYVLYTSGSTGTPKGVAVRHRAALNTVVDFAERCALTERDRVLALSALSFDLSVADVFAVLGTGGALVLPDPSPVADPAHWAELMAAHRVTLWNSVPALLQMLLDHLGDRALPTAGSATDPHPAFAALREVWLSGDWIPVDLPGRLRAAAPAARVTSAGGATEAAIWSIAHVTEERDAARDSIPYGRAMRNQTVHVLNDRYEPCPVGVTGEICVAGVGLADGYWRDPERTARAFVTHPRTGERLYRTGDLGRWLAEGEIEILGREDQQVKIRGHRVELGEVEAALLRLPEVRAAAATVVGGAGRTRRLAAVVVPEHPAKADGAQPAGDTAATGTTAAEYRENFGDDVLTEPAARLAFTAERHATRPPADGVVGHALPATTTGPPPRASHRTYGRRPLPLASLAALLEPLRAHEQAPAPGVAPTRRRYASAGGLYPVRTYVYVADGRVAGLPGGTYQHDPFRHRLLAVSEGARLDPAAHGPLPMLADAAFWLLLVADRAAVDPLYGTRARDFCLLEAGLMAQLVEDAAPAARLGLCQVGALRATDPLRAALGLSTTEEPLHALVGGALADPEVPPTPPAAATGLGDVLRERLSEVLPAPLVPSVYAEVERLPLTDRGKLDRAALTELAEGAASRERPADTPDGPTETAVLAVLHAQLERDDIGVTDHLLELGVDSVLMVRLHRAVQEAVGRTFPLAAMFEHPSVRALAGHLDRPEAPRRTARPDRSERRRAARRRPRN
ncbi:amino acid adenylation domain-containing protein [Streptomyces durbertensis]|uniref:Phenyloxazoline synthase MbtB n=1 Tax=Streptomyces durbertensis TaxID=2448886 RepID=A0ABR6ECM1_9ACTN|nr:non-ribosomal peptide synthetase [Streptomyces durbertensis]MBB1243057.1 amino acid adenylation domain-containing protein [Streptomyces durbertensis]